MNEETNRPQNPVETPDRKSPADVDDLIQQCLNRAAKLIDDVEARELCSLGSLVLRIKASQSEAATVATHKCVTEETVNEFERNANDV
jgi:hypothetical protein